MKPLAASLHRQPRWLLLIAGMALAVVFGVFDAFTEYDVSLFALYSLPIILVAWFSRNPASLLFIAAFSALVWEAADSHSRNPEGSFLYFFGNTLFQFFFFSLLAFVARGVKQRLDRTEAEVSRLERFHILAEISPVGIVRTAADGRCTYVNQRWCDLSGKTADELVGASWTTALHPDDAARVTTEWAHARMQNRPFQFQTRFSNRSGDAEPMWVLGQMAPERDASGAVNGFVGTVTDLTAQRQLEREILGISEREQQRIGQDLHDDLCQFLAAIQYTASSLRDDLRRKGAPEAEEAREVTDLLRQSIARTRSLARTIFPVQLEEQGILSALHELASTASRRYGIRCSFDYERPLPLVLEGPSVATHLYRIAQEALNNAIRHGGARNVFITLQAKGEKVTLTIRDDGSGFPEPPGPCGNGMGLRIMEYRSHMIGGSLTLRNHPDEPGAVVSCSFRNPKPASPPPTT